MKKLLLGALVSASLVGGAGLAHAKQPADPGRDYGQCTAFFNGQKNGHPENSHSVIEGMYDTCQQFGIGGNPSHGRYPECFNQDVDPDNCTD